MKILILDDGNRGNFNQAVGIAERIPSSEIEVITVPGRRILPRLILLLTANLSPFLPLSCIRFLLKLIVFHTDFNPQYPKPCLVISAGARLAPLNLLLSRVYLADSIQVLWPDLLRWSLFDLLVIPEHDLWRHRKTVPARNMMVIKGATNRILPAPSLRKTTATRVTGHRGRQVTYREQSQKLLPLEGVQSLSDTTSAITIAVLIGGNDKNYRISNEWVQKLSERLLEIVRSFSAEVYLTTSRRTPREVEQVLKENLGGLPRFHSVLYRETRANPVAEFLSKADLILTTEDSINMVSESASSGKRTVVLRVERKRKEEAGKFPLVFDRAFRSLEEDGYIKILTLEELTGERVSDLLKSMPEKVLAETEKVSKRVMNLQKEEKILVVGVSCLGDNLILSPVYRAIRLNFPLASIDVITDRRSEGYFEGHPYFRKVYYYDKKADWEKKFFFLKGIRQQGYRFVFDFRQSIFGMKSGAERKAVFYSRADFGPWGDEHEADRWQRLLRYFLPLPEERTFYFPENKIDCIWLEETLRKFTLEKYNYVVLNPGARWIKKRWSIEGFAKLAELIGQKYRLPSVIIGDLDETDLADKIVSSLPLDGQGPQCQIGRGEGGGGVKVINLSGQTTLSRLVALLSGAKLLVSNDTGTVHLAGAVKCPSAVLFGPGDWRRYGPYRIPCRIISSGLSCSPCLKTDCPDNFVCWKELTPEKVLAEINIFLE